MGARFDPGTGWGFIGNGLVALVTANAPDELVHQLDALTRAADVSARGLIEALSQAGIGSLPSLAVVLRGTDGYHLLVRGAVRLGIALDGDFEWLTAPYAASWSEDVRVDATRFALELEGTQPSARPSQHWCERGVVAAARVALDASHFATPAVAAELATAVGPELSRAPAARAPLPSAVVSDSVHADVSPTADPTKAYLRRLIEETRLREPDVESHVDEPAAIADEREVAPADDAAAAESSTTHTLDFDALAALLSTDLDGGERGATATANDEPPAPALHAPGLISSVPGQRAPTTAASASASSPSVDARPLRDLLEPPGDHDGHTVTVETLRAARDAARVGAPSPTVQAVHCPAIHPNPPHAERCRTCGALIADHTVTRITRPTLGELRFDNGDSYPLDRPMLIGRRPSSARDTSVDGEPARLVTLQDPQSLLSKVHLEVRIEDWHVLVIDRNSTNHTIVVLPDRKPTQLHPGDAVQIVPGTLVELGGAARATYEIKA